jgi:hypothetical protein
MTVLRIGAESNDSIEDWGGIITVLRTAVLVILVIVNSSIVHVALTIDDFELPYCSCSPNNR